MSRWLIRNLAPFEVVCAVATAAMLVAGLLGAFGTADREDPEAARFMLECTYDWSLSPTQCRRILEGGDPPPVPEDPPGC